MVGGVSRCDKSSRFKDTKKSELDGRPLTISRFDVNDAPGMA
jgi:hypothetical protein